MTLRHIVIPATLALSLAVAAQNSNEAKPADSKAAQSQTQPGASAQAAPSGGEAPKTAGQRHFPVPKNLQILPKNISEEQLFGVMKSFATSLGWRCTNCHVGEEGKPLSTYDFASDAKKEKGRAREMMKIAQEINASMLPQDVGSMIPSMPNGNGGDQLMSLPLREAREMFEREYLMAQINRFGGNISRTAEFVGMERSALHRKLKALGVG